MTTSFPRTSLISACQSYGAQLTNLPFGILGPQLLWGLSGNESSFGQNCKPRHEPAFDTGGKYADAALLAEFGSDAACSLGPWQLMFPNAPQGMKPSDFNDIDQCATATVYFLNKLLRRFKPNSLKVIGQCWNAGSPLQNPGPGVIAYTDQLARNYEVAML